MLTGFEILIAITLSLLCINTLFSTLLLVLALEVHKKHFKGDEQKNA